MAEVRRFWSEPYEGLIIAVLHKGFVYLNLPTGGEAEIEGDGSCAVAFLREMGYEPEYYDEFDTWEEYYSYVTIGA